MNNGIDLSRYEEISDRLKFGSRICSDGLCCFLTIGFADYLDVNRTSSIGYYSLREDGTINESKRFACENLEVSLENETMAFSCNAYESRHPYCKLYPKGGDYLTRDGRFTRKVEVPSQLCTSQLVKRARETEKIYPFYLFDKEKFPEFAPYALAVEGDHFLVPVPSLEFCNI